MGRKIALITGGSRGIGKCTAAVLAEQGCNIIINYRSSKTEAEKLAKNLSENFAIKAIAVQGDISNKADCEKLIHQSMESFNGIDILIHNAGPYVPLRKTMDEYEWDEWQYMINGNLNSVFYLTKLTLPYMRAKGWGRIVTFGYDRVETAPGWIYRSAFAAAKAGLASLTRTISMEEAKNGITANMICPGDIADHWKEETIAHAKRETSSMVPVGRPGTGEDLARVVSFLISDDADFITGSTIPVTGGQDVLGKIYHADYDSTI
ncbi:MULTISPECIES: SDR family oxidoreductase [Bacillaceae]|uniref:3-oxoacyl-ACP reductase n=1 Tax=Pseudobacillus wudalianchiensis TaxID=1743143 RepID=A0A1B9B9T0_9BACI|nr:MULTISPECIES: SDR family oxidoreductase [Bacillus]KMY54530.1 3-ketoacyl-ACP reductase [Bacillus sp. FJAT-27231]OCA92832.1 3-oxoacyl-ACP reductase [Bacillus wudalianchiensis]